MFDIPPGWIAIITAILTSLCTIGGAWFVFRGKKVEIDADREDSIDTQEAEFRAELREANRELMKQNKEQNATLKDMEKTNKELEQRVTELTLESKADKAAVAVMSSKITALEAEVERLRLDIVKLIQDQHDRQGSRP